MKSGPDMSVNLAGIMMRNPVMVASGTFGYGVEYAGLVDIEQLGAIVVKGIRLEPCSGNPQPRIVEVRSGLINSIGLQGPGVEGFIADYLPLLRRWNTPVIVNVWGTTLREYAEVCGRLDGMPGVSGIELNVSCPNVKQGGLAFGSNPRMTARVVAVARRKTRLPLFCKLAPNVPDIRVFARAAEESGADGISLVNSFPAMKIDVEKRAPVLGNVTGGLTGPAIHPIAVKLVRDAASAVSIPVVGMGGITDADDALEFLIAGASAVAVGTANFADPRTAIRVAAGIRSYLKRHGFGSVREIVGMLGTP